MIRHSWSRSYVLLGLLVIAAAAPQAAADWLVTTDGEQIETAGPWEVRGRLLVATLVDGRTVSMRASTVDLPASERLTAETARAAEQEPAAEAQAGEPAPRKKAAIVLTDADFTRRAPRPVMEEENAGDEGEPDEAVSALDEAEQRYDGDFSPNVRPVAATRARVLAAAGEVDAGLAWARRQALSATDGATYLREYEHVTLVRVLLADHAVSGNQASLADATALLDRLLPAAEQGGRTGVARRHCVHPHLRRTPFRGEALGHGDDGGFRRRIGRAPAPG